MNKNSHQLFSSHHRNQSESTPSQRHTKSSRRGQHKAHQFAWKYNTVVKLDGIIHIQASANNTIFVLTDVQGNVKDWMSGGRLGLKGSARGTSFASELMTKWVIKQVRQFGWKLVKIWVGGFGQGRFSAIRTLSQTNKFKVLLVKDVTPFPYGGCRPKKRRRI